jgi:selenocysteine lyase/cysteine desulfurase
MRWNIRVACGALAFALAANLAHAGVNEKRLSEQIGESVRKALEEELSKQSQKEQEATKRLADQLEALPLDQLYFLKMSNVCNIGTFNCEGLRPERVTSFIDIELDRRRAEKDAADKEKTFLISMGSFGVSACAFVVSVFGMLRKKA